MSTVPVVRTFVAGEVVLASYFNTNINGPIGWLLASAIFRGRANATQSVSNSTWTSINLQVEDVDSVGGHSTVTNTSRYTAVYAGWYRCSGGVMWAASATGRRMTRWAVNGSLVEASGTVLPTTAASTTVTPATSELIFLNVGDYVEIQGFQESGGSLNASTTTGSESNSRMDAVWTSN